MSMCRWAPSSFARRSSGRRRSAASRLPRSGASGRSSGVSADTFTDRFARGSTPALSRSSCGRSGQRARGRHQRVERVGAAVGVALRLGLGDRRLAEQVDRRRHAVLQQVAQHAQRRLRVLADDEPVRHVLDAGRGGRAERRAARLRVAHPHRHPDGGGGCSTSPRKPVRWRARSSRLRQAGTTSTNRNSAAFSSASAEARSIAFSSNAFSGFRVTGIAAAEPRADGQSARSPVRARPPCPGTLRPIWPASPHCCPSPPRCTTRRTPRRRSTRAWWRHSATSRSSW